LTGGRLTWGVVRVEDTVGRPTGPHSPFVHALLRHLERAGFTAAPRFLGIDARGRGILSYRDGQLPDNLDPGWTDGQLAAAARLLRRFHDTTAGSPLAGAADVVCHGDISPVNTVFIGGRPAALIDFDLARPGPRICDVAYGLFLWLNLGWDGPPPREQRRRIHVRCDAYA
jgi:Ser/Thr protein kinase RdoA (MazF antagonist)